MSITKGQAAPDFQLYNTEKELVTLSEQKGKNVVLLFFPAAFTGVCTKELCRFRDEMSQYNNLNAQVYGISVDLPFTLGEFKKQQNYNFPLLSDFNKEVASNYGSLYGDWILGLKGVAKRSAFVIDKAGIVQYAEVLEDAGKEPDYAKIDAVLAELN
ncbi:MAG: redoxin domain-containing protein [Bacteroidetes bacterium]|nr:redoxin domain-containing protein [Bacteroidota bacterium]